MNHNLFTTLLLICMLNNNGFKKYYDFINSQDQVKMLPLHMIKLGMKGLGYICLQQLVALKFKIPENTNPASIRYYN